MTLLGSHRFCHNPQLWVSHHPWEEGRHVKPRYLPELSFADALFLGPSCKLRAVAQKWDASTAKWDHVICKALVDSI